MSSDSIIPEGFDLKAARNAHSTTPHETQPRCPKCKSVKIHVKGSGPAWRINPEPYRCGNCGEHFDEPAEPETERENE